MQSVEGGKPFPGATKKWLKNVGLIPPHLFGRKVHEIKLLVHLIMLKLL